MNAQDSTEILRELPRVDRLLEQPEVLSLKERWQSALVDEAVRARVQELREAIRNGALDGRARELITPEAIGTAVRDALERRLAPGIRRCVNATGVVLHTGLGRAVLPPAALEAIRRELDGYSVVSVAREDGQRVRREHAISRMLQALTGAEAATVVNNNAAATMIALNTLAAGREVILSRGQLVEIGGSFRMPDVFEAAGVRLREVGTTNRTHLRDYANAIGDETGLLLRVHPSNFKVIGFEKSVSLAELVELGRERGIPIMDDLGAGALVDLPPEPRIEESLRTGADVICCSGDKLIGGPQSGILLGKRTWIDAIRRNPLFRALRVDKMTLAALEATLGLFLRAEGPGEDHPSLQMLRREAEELKAHARRLASRIRKALPEWEVGTEAGFSQVGSGSLPGESLPTTLVALQCPGTSAAHLARTLRLGSTPLFTRVVEERVCLDPRTLRAGEDAVVVALLQESSPSKGKGNR